MKKQKTKLKIGSSKSKIKTLTSDHKAITLIALIITIIVMLILVAVTVSVALNGGLIGKAQEAKTGTQYEKDKEMLYSSVVGAFNDKAEVDFEKLNGNLPEGFTKAEDGGYTSKSGNTYYVTKNGSITDKKPEEGIQATEKGEAKTITASNVAEFLGKKVTNYTGKSQVTIGGTTYTVSPEYRLYYIDFAGKYGEKNTVYLKAECTSGNNKALQTTEPQETDVVKIKELNPGLYYEEDADGMPIAEQEIDPPSSGNDNMKAVTWLTNTNNWEGLKPSSYTNGIAATDINYIVGAPSLEMMMDSYNTHYELTGNTPDTSSLNANSNRVKLFYQYPYTGNSNRYGYGVGPYNSSSATNGYYTYTSDYSVKTDTIDTMYYPGNGNGNYYWLASPSAYGTTYVMFVGYGDGDFVGSSTYYYDYAFCPLVSLKSSVNLTLE